MDHVWGHRRCCLHKHMASHSCDNDLEHTCILVKVVPFPTSQKLRKGFSKFGRSGPSPIGRHSTILLG
jgi:hypothetical protein